MPFPLFSPRAHLFLSYLVKRGQNETKHSQEQAQGWGTQWLHHSPSMSMWLHPTFSLHLASLYDAKTCPAVLNFLQKSLAEPMTAVFFLASGLRYPY